MYEVVILGVWCDIIASKVYASQGALRKPAGTVFVVRNKLEDSTYA
jgi:hypothetical protein